MNAAARAHDLDELRGTLVRNAREGVWASVTRCVVLEECASTQDEARARCGGLAGLLVVAARQTQGRGRLGRAWNDEHGLGVAATFVVDAGAGAATLSLAAGLAACRAVELALPRMRHDDPSAPRPMLRWPNDVVVGRGGPVHTRKVAGVLVESDARLARVGIGINTLQCEADFPEGIRSRCTSLRMLGSDWSRARVVDALATLFSVCLARPAHALASEWMLRDCLVGTRQTFVHNGEQRTGTVASIDPLARITLHPDGSSSDVPALHLPALSTSLVHEDSAG